MKSQTEAVFFHGTGCDRCKGRGYLGRVALIEALPVSEAVRRLIVKRASSSVITRGPSSLGTSFRSDDIASRASALTPHSG